MATTYTSTNVKIDEHKAPTDQSIRILSEMQDKAVKSIIERVSASENGFKFEAIFYKDEIGANVRFDVKFNFNGEMHYVDGFITQDEVYRIFEVSRESLTTSEAFRTALRNKAAQVIADYIFIP